MLARDNIDLKGFLDIYKNNIFATLNCHGIGRIIDFNSQNQTCTIQVMQLKKSLDITISPSIICDVPLVVYGTYNAYMTLPNPVGCNVLLFFMDRNMDAFMETGEQYLPETARKHNMTDCVAMLMFRDYTHSIENYDLNAINIAYKKVIEDVTNNATIKNFGDKVELKTDTNDGEEEKSSVITETATNITLTSGGKIKLNNSEKNLATLIQSLITTIKAITITNSAVSSGSQAALTNVANEFAQLLE